MLIQLTTTAEPELPGDIGFRSLRGSPQLWRIQVCHPFRQSQHSSSSQRIAWDHLQCMITTWGNPTSGSVGMDGDCRCGWSAVSAAMRRDSRGRLRYRWCRRPSETGSLANEDRCHFTQRSSGVRPKSLPAFRESHLIHSLCCRQTRIQSSSSSPLWSGHSGGSIHTPPPDWAPG